MFQAEKSVWVRGPLSLGRGRLMVTLVVAGRRSICRRIRRRVEYSAVCVFLRERVKLESQCIELE